MLMRSVIGYKGLTAARPVIPAVWEAEAGGLQIKVTLGYRLSSWPAWATVMRSCNVKGTPNSPPYC